MAIIRVTHKKNYLVVLNATVLDQRLKLATRGFLLALLTLPDDWRFNLRDLARRLHVNKDTAGKYLTALQKAGYCEISKARSTTGRYEAEYIVHEEPVRKSRTGPVRLYQPGKVGRIKYPLTKYQEEGLPEARTSAEERAEKAKRSLKIPSSLREEMKKEARETGLDISFIGSTFWEAGEADAKKHGYSTEAILANWRVAISGAMKPKEKACFFWADYSQHALYRINGQRKEIDRRSGDLHPAVQAIIANAAEAHHG